MNNIYEIKDFSLENNDLSLYETIFHNANGYIGVRSCFEEGYPISYDTIRGAYINGFYDIAEMKQAEKLCGLTETKQTMLNVADMQGIRFTLDGEPFDLFTGTMLASRRYVDMAKGITGREVTWRSPSGTEVRISSRRMASFAQLSLFTIEYQIESLNFNGTIAITSTHHGDVKNYCNPDDPRIAGESFTHLVPEQAELDGGDSYLLTATSGSGLHVCTGVHHELYTGDAMNPAAMNTRLDGHGAISTTALSLTTGSKITLVKYTVFTDSLRHSSCQQAARLAMKQALRQPLTRLYAAQQEYLEHFFNQSLLEIEGDDELALATRYNQYQLLQSIGKDAYSNIAAKGLSGEGYEGHYFWDTEMYIQPFFTLTNPDLSRNLISYRYQILDAARENARILGHESGALYPWRTISGRECSGYFPSGSAAYHINGDIAYSIIAYYLATKDLGFIAEKGAEILFETARLWLDAGNYHEGHFHIKEVTGPDEYTCMTDNNYYTNACAKYNLYWAVKFHELLTAAGLIADVAARIALRSEEIEAFRQAETAMYLPYNEKLQINPQDDSFLSKKMWDIEATPADKFPLLLHYHPLYLYRHQVCKQADTVLAHFLLEDMQDLETMRNSFAYYEKITTHDSSLSTCIYSIMASRLGLTDKAYEYFGDSARLDLFNTHANTKDGIHTANMGGNYMSIVYGFAGLRLKEAGLLFRPALPKQWSGYRFRIQYEGSQIEAEIREDGCCFTLLGGAPKDIQIYDTVHHLNGTLQLPLQKAAPRKYSTVIFDLDGVICHTDQYHYLAWKQITDELAIDFDEEINNRLRGVSRMESLDIILEKYDGNLSPEEKSHYAERKNDVYKKLLQNMSPADLKPEVKATLDYLRASGITLAIGSSSRNARFILERLGLGNYFDAISDGNNISQSKPDPEVFLKAAQYSHRRPDECLVVEDAAAGLQAARAAGMDCAAIGDATNSDLATYRLTSLRDLRDICVLVE